MRFSFEGFFARGSIITTRAGSGLRRIHHELRIDFLQEVELLRGHQVAGDLEIAPELKSFIGSALPVHMSMKFASVSSQGTVGLDRFAGTDRTAVIDAVEGP